MSSRRKGRGISLGTIVMLVVTMAVCAGLAYLLPGLQGNQPVQVDTGKVLEALNLSGLPQLSLNDIPIQLNPADAPLRTESAEAATAQLETANTAAAPVQPTIQATAAPTLVATQTPTAAPTQVPDDQTFTMAFTGSVMLETSIRQGAWISEAGKYDFSEMLMYMKPELASADLCVVPLENIIDDDADFTDNVTTSQVVPMLADAGVDAVALAYPKLANSGQAGVQTTVDAVQRNGLSVLGAYASEADAAQIKLMNLSGAQVAVLHYTDSLSSTGQKKLRNEDASYAVRIGSEEQIARDIAAARQAGADFVVVSINWGEENDAVPNSAEKKLAQTIAESGADVIVGTGTRAAQPVVWLDAKRDDGTTAQTLCAYSLGAFLNEGRTDKNVASFVLQLTVSVSYDGSVKIVGLDCVPTYTWRYKEDGVYKYFVVPSAEVAPDDMSEAQITSKERALKNIRNLLADSPLTVP